MQYSTGFKKTFLLQLMNITLSRASFIIVVAVMACSVLTACSDYLPKQGEVARVNGHPIFLKDLQAFQDSSTLGLTSYADDSVEKLRKSYSLALSELVIIELVNAELAKRKLSVTDDEVAKEEALLRADYPEGEFERQALEDSLDLDSWRLQLKGRLAVQRLRQQVLQPEINVSSQEFKEYYQSHTKTIPAQLHFRILQAGDPKILAQAAALSLGNTIPENFQVEFPEVSVREGRLATERIEIEALSALSKLKPHQSGQIIKDDYGYVCYVLVEKIAEREISVTDSFKLNEEAILEEKLEYAFKLWLAAALRKAKISVSSYLIQPQPDQGGAAVKTEEAMPGDGVDSSPLPVLPAPGGVEDRPENESDGNMPAKPGAPDPPGSLSGPATPQPTRVC